MIEFILNSEDVATQLPAGMTLLDFVRYRKNLKGTKIGCREGDCGACNVLIGELSGNGVVYRTMTSCLTPLANVRHRHVVTIEGINPEDGVLTPVQKAIVEQNGTQCGFCTVGFVVSLTGYLLEDGGKTAEGAVSSIDGNICRCTGYKSLERAAALLCGDQLERSPKDDAEINRAGKDGYDRDTSGPGIVPAYFKGIKDRLVRFKQHAAAASRADPNDPAARRKIVGGGTDLYVQRPEDMAGEIARHVFFEEDFRGVGESEGIVEIGASSTVTDLMMSPVMQGCFPDLYRHLKLVSSTPIRNMATLAGNLVNASPIGDMTVWFLALDADINVEHEKSDGAPKEHNGRRVISLKDLFLGYKLLDLEPGEHVSKITFRNAFSHFNFEKVCKRTYLDIATVNTAISLEVTEEKGNTMIKSAHVAAGGVAPVPLYLRGTSKYLTGKPVNTETVLEASRMIQKEIRPISDVRGSKEYKRLLLRQLFFAHFVEIFDLNVLDR